MLPIDQTLEHFVNIFKHTFLNKDCKSNKYKQAHLVMMAPG